MTRAVLCLALLLFPLSAMAADRSYPIPPHECEGVDYTRIDTARCKLALWEHRRDELYQQRAALWRCDGIDWRNFDAKLPPALVEQIERAEERVRAFMRDVEEEKR